MVWDVDVGLDYQGTLRRDVSAAVSGKREMSTIRGVFCSILCYQCVISAIEGLHFVVGIVEGQLNYFANNKFLPISRSINLISNL